MDFAINKAKKKEWIEVLEEVENDIWGEGYQTTTRRIRQGNVPYKLAKAKVKEIARALFPVGDTDIRKEGTVVGTPPFDEAERMEAVTKISLSKALGPDASTPKATKILVKGASVL
ncbi:hypothetical protein WA026_012360 [Henosepilachna vigintioctopunctata]|uniref:Uncharacterized protein n=1 Tax=Henosepilachna vigintioctopunctata TaxID=420089 RepID=A0AAW1V158_9CUCU